MLESYLYYYVWLEVILTLPYILIPGSMPVENTQTQRIFKVILWTPIYGRILGWW